MQCVYLKHSHHINLLLDSLYWHEMTTWVNHQSTIMESWFIFYRYRSGSPADAFHFLRAFNFGRQQLQESLHTVEQSLWSLGRNIYAIGSYIQFVSLIVTFSRCIDCQVDSTIIGYSELVSCRTHHFIGKELGYGLRFRSRSSDYHAIGKFKLSVLLN